MGSIFIKNGKDGGEDENVDRGCSSSNQFRGKKAIMTILPGALFKDFRSSDDDIYDSCQGLIWSEGQNKAQPAT